MQMIVHTPSTVHPLPRHSQSDKQSSRTVVERTRSEAVHTHIQTISIYSTKRSLSSYESHYSAERQPIPQPSAGRQPKLQIVSL